MLIDAQCWWNYMSECRFFYHVHVDVDFSLRYNSFVLQLLEIVTSLMQILKACSFIDVRK